MRVSIIFSVVSQKFHLNIHLKTDSYTWLLIGLEVIDNLEGMVDSTEAAMA